MTKDLAKLIVSYLGPVANIFFGTKSDFIIRMIDKISKLLEVKWT